jgi:hypothetical protein
VHVIGEPHDVGAIHRIAAIREMVYTWTRRIFAAADLTASIAELRLVPPPRNVLFIGIAHEEGTQTKQFGGALIKFKVAGRPFRLRVNTGATARVIAQNISERIMEVLPRLRAQVHEVIARTGPDAVRAFNAHDVVVFDEQWNPVEVTEVSTEDPDLVVAQVLSTDFDARGGGLECSDRPQEASFQERALFWNFATDNAINVFITPADTVLLNSVVSGEPLAKARPGLIGSREASVAPAVFFTRNFALVGQLLAHEIGHILMHCLHAMTPLRDEPPATSKRDDRASESELMGSPQAAGDTHDMDRHISDAPIAAIYDVLEPVRGPTGSFLTPGQNLSGNLAAGGRMCPFDATVLDTPALRMRHFARRYGVSRLAKTLVKLDPHLRRAPQRAPAGVP